MISVLCSSSWQLCFSGSSCSCSQLPWVLPESPPCCPSETLGAATLGTAPLQSSDLCVLLVTHTILKKSVKSYLLKESSSELLAAIKEKSKTHFKSTKEKYRLLKPQD